MFYDRIFRWFIEIINKFSTRGLLSTVSIKVIFSILFDIERKMKKVVLMSYLLDIKYFVSLPVMLLIQIPQKEFPFNWLQLGQLAAHLDHN